MSYCHLTRSGKVLNFHSRIATLMKNRLAAASCVKTITDLEVSAGPDVFYCEGEDGFLRGSVSGGTPPLDVKWTPASGLENDTTLVQPVNVQRTTDYILTVTDDRGSRGVDTVRVTVHPRVRATLSESYDVCSGSALRLRLQNVGGTAPHQYRWLSSEIDTTTSTPTLVIRPDEDQLLTVSVIDANGCGDQATTMIKMYDPPIVTIDALDNTFCKGDSVRVIARVENSGTLVYEWYRNDKGFTVGGPSIDVNALVGDEFTVIVKNEVGCSDTASIALDVHDIQMRTMYESIEVPAVAPCKNTFQSWVTILNEGTDPVTIHEVDGEGLKATIEELPYTLDPGTSHVFRTDVEFETGTTINGKITFREATCGREITIDVRGEHGTVFMVDDAEPSSFNTVNGCLAEAVRTVDVEVTNDSRSTITITRGYAREHDRRMRVITGATIEAGQTATVTFEEVLPVMPSITSDEIEVTYESQSCTGTLVFDARTPVFNVTGEYPDEIRFDSPVSPELEDVRQEIAVTVSSPSEEPATVTSVSVTGPFSTSLEVGQMLPVNTEVPVSVIYHPSRVDDDVESVGQLNFEVNSCDNFTPITLRAIRNVVSVDEDELVTNVDQRVVGDELTLVATNAQVDILNLKGERVLRVAVQGMSVIDVSRFVPGVHVVVINEADGRQERLTILVE